nr:hypothetical protein [Tanacetum cinerariifolium]
MFHQDVCNVSGKTRAYLMVKIDKAHGGVGLEDTPAVEDTSVVEDTSTSSGVKHKTKAVQKRGGRKLAKIDQDDV